MRPHCPLFFVSCLALCWTLLVPWTVHAGYPDLNSTPQLAKTGANDVAVIVAIEDYFLLPNVAGAVENANAWETFFRRGLGVEHVHMLTDSRAAREDIFRFARRAVEDVDEEGTLWFVFIGHGAPTTDGEDGVLVGVDARGSVDSLEARGVPQRELIQTLEAGRQRQTVAIIDACFSGRASNDEALARGMQYVIPSQLMEPSDTTVIISAAQSDQFAGPLPGADRPAFSYLLLGALRGWAADGGSEVSAEQALWWVRQRLRSLDHDQIPELTGNGEVVLTRNVSEQDPGIAELMSRGGRSAPPVVHESRGTARSEDISDFGQSPLGARISEMRNEMIHSVSRRQQLRFSYEEQRIGGIRQYVLVPQVEPLIATADDDHEGLSWETAQTAFESLRFAKRATYGNSWLDVHEDFPNERAATINIDSNHETFAPIIVAEAYFTLTRLGIDSITVPYLDSRPITEADIAIPAYAYEHPSTRGRTTPVFMLQMPANVALAHEFDSSVDFLVSMADGTFVTSADFFSIQRPEEHLCEFLDAIESYAIRTTLRAMKNTSIACPERVIEMRVHPSPPVRQFIRTELCDELDGLDCVDD